MGRNYLPIPKRQRYNHPTLYWACNYYSMLGLNHVSKSGPWWSRGVKLYCVRNCQTTCGYRQRHNIYLWMETLRISFLVFFPKSNKLFSSVLNNSMTCVPFFKQNLGTPISKRIENMFIHSSVFFMRLIFVVVRCYWKKCTFSIQQNGESERVTPYSWGQGIYACFSVVSQVTHDMWITSLLRQSHCGVILA